MTYGPAKRRDIARSVLPSTHRTGARADLAAIKRRSRRAIRQELHVITGATTAAAVVEEWDAAPLDPVGYPAADIHDAVRRRRGGDKLGPLLRWGRATTRHLPLEERLPAVSRHFDDNLIGRHAITHLELDPHFRIDHPHNRWYWGRTNPPVDVAPLQAIVVRAMEHGEHGDLNRWMRLHPTDKGAVRLLAGWHDVEAFAAACTAQTAWRRAVHRFAATTF